MSSARSCVVLAVQRKTRLESLWLLLFSTLCDPAFIRVISIE